MLENFSNVVKEISLSVRLGKVAQKWMKVSEKMTMDQSEQDAKDTLEKYLQLAQEIEHWTNDFQRYQQVHNKIFERNLDKKKIRLSEQLHHKFKNEKDQERISPLIQQHVEGFLNKERIYEQLRVQSAQDAARVLNTTVRTYGIFVLDCIERPGSYSQEHTIFSQALIDQMEQLMHSKEVLKKHQCAMTIPSRALLIQMGVLMGSSLLPVAHKVCAYRAVQEGTLDAQHVQTNIEEHMLRLTREMRSTHNAKKSKNNDEQAQKSNKQAQELRDGRMKASAYMECAQVHYLKGNMDKVQQYIDDAYCCAGYQFCKDELGLDEKGKVISKALVKGFIEAAQPMLELAHQSYASSMQARMGFK